MASWLVDPRAQEYLDNMGRSYTRARAEVRELLEYELNYPGDANQLGEFAPYARVALPVGYRSVAQFQRDCLAKTGVLVGMDRWSIEPSGRTDNEPPCLRLFLGASTRTLREAVARLAEAGYRYR